MFAIHSDRQIPAAAYQQLVVTCYTQLMTSTDRVIFRKDEEFPKVISESIMTKQKTPKEEKITGKSNTSAMENLIIQYLFFSLKVGFLVGGGEWANPALNRES